MEGPRLVCQLGGANAAALAEAARRVESFGYAGINYNCGCPSDRVAGKGCFGAALMLNPELARDCVAAMRAAVRIPISVKCRIGADDADSYAELARFISVVSEGGCNFFIVHARKCLLKGLSPKDNRNIPPLRYHWVQRLALDFPAIQFGINGGVGTIDLAVALLALKRVPVSPALADMSGVAIFNDDAIAAEPEVSRAEEQTWKRVARLTKAKAPADVVQRAKAAVTAGPTEPETGSTGDTNAEHDCSCTCDAPLTGAEPQPPPERTVGAAVEAAAAPAVPRAQTPTDGVVASPTASIAGVAFPLYERCSPGSPSPGVYGSADHVLHSVMVGRAAYNNSWILADVDRRLFGVPNPGFSRREVVRRYLEYCEALAAGEGLPPDEIGLALYRPFELLKPLIGLFHGEPGGGRFRATLAHDCQSRKLPLRECVANALACLPDAVLDALPPE
jgi:tRNA-dihydrouridine synthase